jgi:plasmid stability protein
MPDLTIALTDGEKRRLDIAAAALGKSVEQLVSDELRWRYLMVTRASDVVILKGSVEVSHGHD